MLVDRSPMPIEIRKSGIELSCMNSSPYGWCWPFDKGWLDHSGIEFGRGDFGWSRFAGEESVIQGFLGRNTFFDVHVESSAQ